MHAGVVSRDLTEGRKLGDTCVGWGGGNLGGNLIVSVYIFSFSCCMIMFQGMIFSSPPVGEDFTSVARNITFAPNQTVTCGSIPIVDDNTQEVPEAFMVCAVHTCRDANYIASSQLVKVGDVL